MTDISCPACGHQFRTSGSDAASSPDPSVVRWFSGDPAWTGEASTDEIYTDYLRSTDAAPVSRERFVADLAHLGIEEVLDDDTPMLLRP